MPYNPGNVRKLNALGGKRPQATGIAILPKNAGNVLATSEGSVNNYGGNKKTGLYSNVGMSYLFQNTQLTGARINGNMPYFHGGDTTTTKKSSKTKNMITIRALDDGDGNDDEGTKGFVSSPYWNQISHTILNGAIQPKFADNSMGKVNGKGRLQVGDAKIIAIEMWRGTQGANGFGPVDWSIQPGIHIWASKPISFGEVVIREGGKRTHFVPQAVYDKDNLPPTHTAAPASYQVAAAAGNANNQVSDSLTANGAGKYFFPSESVFTGAGLATGHPLNEIPSTTTVYWCPFPPNTRTVTRISGAGPVTITEPNPAGVNARLIFPRSSHLNANDANTLDIGSTMSVYFK